MSTKIYNGIRFNTSSFNDISGLIDSWRPVVLKEIATLWRFHAYNIYKQGGDSFLGLRQLFKDDPNIMRDFKITIFPNRLTPRYTLGIIDSFSIYTNDVYLNDHTWLSSRGQVIKATEYAYWDNTDKPDDIPEREWNRREKHWDFLTAAPIMTQGATFTIAPEFTALAMLNASREAKRKIDDESKGVQP